VIEAALRTVIARGYDVNKIDKLNGVIAFQTGWSLRSYGQDLSLLVVADGANACSVSINSRLQRGQLFDWGEGSEIASNIFDLIQRDLEPDRHELKLRSFLKSPLR